MFKTMVPEGEADVGGAQVPLAWTGDLGMGVLLVERNRLGASSPV